MKKKTAAVILAIALLVGTLFGCFAVQGAGIGIRIARIRRIQFISGFVGVATDQHYYGIYLSGDIAHPIKIEQLD
jgi:predicted small secreted protein